MPAGPGGAGQPQGAGCRRHAEPGRQPPDDLPIGVHGNAGGSRHLDGPALTVGDGGVPQVAPDEHRRQQPQDVAGAHSPDDAYVEQSVVQRGAGADAHPAAVCLGVPERDKQAPLDNRLPVNVQAEALRTVSEGQGDGGGDVGQRAAGLPGPFVDQACDLGVEPGARDVQEVAVAAHAEVHRAAAVAVQAADGGQRLKRQACRAGEVVAGPCRHHPDRDVGPVDAVDGLVRGAVTTHREQVGEAVGACPSRDLRGVSRPRGEGDLRLHPRHGGCDDVPRLARAPAARRTVDDAEYPHARYSAAPPLRTRRSSSLRV